MDRPIPFDKIPNDKDVNINPLSLGNVTKILYIDPKNAVFSSENNILSLEFDNGTEKTLYKRVFLHRAFPFDCPNEFISVLNDRQAEIGIIRNVSDFDENTQNIIFEELNRKYYIPEITKILSIKEKFGFSFWSVEVNGAPAQLSVQDTYRSILKVSDEQIFLTDSNGNRYEIPNIDALDKKSFRKLAIYL